MDRCFQRITAMVYLCNAVLDQGLCGQRSHNLSLSPILVHLCPPSCINIEAGGAVPVEKGHQSHSLHPAAASPCPGELTAGLGGGQGPVHWACWTPASAGTAVPAAHPGSGAACPLSGRRRTSLSWVASGPSPGPGSAGRPCSPEGGTGPQ